MRLIALLALLVTVPAGATPLPDYAASNAALAATPPAPGQPRIVFIGDSTTLFWATRDPGFFHDPTRINRGIGNQSTGQLRHRFAADVLALHPTAVHIMAGIIDIARGDGAEAPDTRDNLAAMAAAAAAAGARVYLASTLPSDTFLRQQGKHHAAAVVALNDWLRAEASAQGYTYIDYYAVLADKAGAFRRDYSSDDLHPNAYGYGAMDRVARRALADAPRAPVDPARPPG